MTHFLIEANGMTLRKRLFWLFVPLLLLTLLSAFWLSERILLSRFDSQDRSLLLNDAERLRSALDYMLKNNLNLLSTYSGWDDSYEFMLGNRPDFARSNLDEQSLALLNFDFMVFLDNQQQVVTEQWLPPDLSEMLSSNQQHPSDYDSLRQAILQLGRRLIQLDQASPSELGRGQLLLVQGTPLLLVVSPISNNQSTATRAMLPISANQFYYVGSNSAAAGDVNTAGLCQRLPEQPVINTYLTASPTSTEPVMIRLADALPTQPAIGYDQIYYKQGRYRHVATNGVTSTQWQKAFDDACEDSGQDSTAKNGITPTSKLNDRSSFTCKAKVANYQSLLKTAVVGPKVIG